MRKWLIGMVIAGLLTSSGLAAAEEPVVTITPVPPTAYDILSLPEWEVTASPYGGKLLLSDSPEMVSTDGIMYQDTVDGTARLFFHHVNATTEPKRLVILLENSSSEAAKVTVYKQGIGGPGYDWMAVGKAAQVAYLANADVYELTVPAHGAATMYPGLGGVSVSPNELVNGLFDFQTDRPVTVKVMQTPVGVDSRKFALQATVLPPDAQGLRGTFDGMDRLILPTRVYDPGADGPVVVTLADNKIDQYSEGIDATTGRKVVNYGNYGVVYRLFLPSSGQGSMAYYLNPRGGDYAGAIGVKHLQEAVPPVLTPVGRTAFGADKFTDFAPIGQFRAGESLWLTFSPPGASNLPVKLVILPRE